MAMKPTIERVAEIPGGMAFQFRGRVLVVVRTYGTDRAAPVIVEEMTDSARALKGQFGLWAVDGVMRAANKQGWR